MAQIQLGTSVKYLSTDGNTKLALVTATPETITPGGSLPELEDGYVNLLVITPTGKTYGKVAVPSEETARATGEHEADEPIRGTWQPLA